MIQHSYFRSQTGSDKSTEISTAPATLSTAPRSATSTIIQPAIRSHALSSPSPDRLSPSHPFPRTLHRRGDLITGAYSLTHNLRPEKLTLVVSKKCLTSPAIALDFQPLKQVILASKVRVPGKYLSRWSRLAGILGVIVFAGQLRMHLTSNVICSIVPLRCAFLSRRPSTAKMMSLSVSTERVTLAVTLGRKVLVSTSIIGSETALLILRWSR